MSTPQWQRDWQAAITDPAVLIKQLDLNPALIPGALAAADAFSLRVPPSYLQRIRPGDPTDPLLRQVLPIDAETRPTPGFSQDPVGDSACLHDGGVIHKYHGRALLVATGACAINCRYCFRRHFPYAEANASAHQWSEALAYLAADPSIHEVILSGGDPLSLNDRRLRELSERLDTITHLRRLRIHSRLPVVLPSRIDSELLAWLTQTRLATVMVIHANHPNELNAEVAEAMQTLQHRGVRLFNQAVLLDGVNNQAEILAGLSERLFELGIQPYYLHLLDRVQGAGHFAVEKHQACSLMRALAAQLPGYLLPQLVEEIAGAPWKVPIDWQNSASTPA
jgi:EF-P beta-lysylation protein EpmB